MLLLTRVLFLLFFTGIGAFPAQNSPEIDGEESRRILGSSVVTSVSVIRKTENGTQIIDAVGKPVPKPPSGTYVASPIDLLNPDRYEFFTFDDNGDLIKRLMTLEEIQSIIANGDGEDINYDSGAYLPEKKVDDVVSNVQNVLKQQIASHRNVSGTKPVLDTPDVSDTWSMILPAIFNNNADGVVPMEKPAMAVTPDTIVVEMITEKLTRSTTSSTTSLIPETTPVVSSTTTTTPTPTTTISTTTEEVTLPSSTSPSSTTTTTREKPQTQYIPITKPSEQFADVKPIDKDPDVVTVTLISDTKFDTSNLPVGGASPIISISSIEEVIPSATTSATSLIPVQSNPTTEIKFSSTSAELSISTTSAAPTPSTAEPIVEAETEAIKIQAYAPISEPIQAPAYSQQTALDKKEQNSKDDDERTTIKTDLIDEKVSEGSDDNVEDQTEQNVVMDLTEKSVEMGSSAMVMDQTEKSSSALVMIDQTEKSSSAVVVDQTEKSSSPTVMDQTEKSSSATVTDQTEKSVEIESSTVVADQTEKSSSAMLMDQTEISSPEVITEQIDKLSSTVIMNETEKLSSALMTDQTEKSVEIGSPSSAVIMDQTEKSVDVESTAVVMDQTETSAEQESSTVMDQSDDESALTNQTTEKENSSESNLEIIQTSASSSLAQSSTPILLIIQENPATEKLILQDSSSESVPVTETSTRKPITTTTNPKTDKPSTIKIIYLTEKTVANILSSTTQASLTTPEEISTISKLIATTERSNTVKIVPLTEKLITTIGAVSSSTPKEEIEVTEDGAEITAETWNPSTPESTTEIDLNQLLLSSTNIYEINNELAAVTLSDVPDVSEDDNSATTETSLISSIQQLISQTVNDQNVDEQIVDSNSNEKVEEILENMDSKPMVSVQGQAATIASVLIDEDVEENITEESDESLKLSEAVSSVLSQIYSQSLLTTTENDPVTEVEGVSKIEVVTDEENQSIITDVTEKTLEIGKEENITAESSQTIITEISTNDAEDKTDDLIKSDKKEDDELIRIEVIRPIESQVSSAVEDFDKLKNNTEATTLSSVLSSTIPIKIAEIQGEKSVDNQPVKKIKIDDVIVAQADNNLKPSAVEEITSTIRTVFSSSAPIQTIKDNAKNSSTWTLVSTILPHNLTSTTEAKPPQLSTPPPVTLSQQNLPGFGLEDTTSKLDMDIYQFVELCNELSFGFWNAVTHGISTARSVFVSPFAATSLLAMVFLGARGATSGEMNEILRLDDMVTFNPHLIFKNVSESIEASKSSGVAVSVIARELYSDRGRGKLLNFYKERAKQFYDGHVEEVNFKEVGDVIRRRTNLIVKKNSAGRIGEYLKDNSVTMRPPLAGISASIFQTDCTSASTEGRDGELHFIVLPSIRQRRLVPIPAVVFRTDFLAGYDPTLDATAAAIGTQEQITSTILIIPGQQGIAAPGDGLSRIEKQLSETAFKKGAWTRLLRALIPRPGLELQIPRFSHKSVINATVALQRMGLKDLFNYGKADLRGLNGAAHELHLSDVLQLNNFATCGEAPINSEQHHSEIYPATSRRPYRRTKKLGHYVSDSVFSDISDEPRDYQRAFHDPLHDPNLLSLPLPLRPRQARIPDAPRLRFDRPFLFYVRHNPTGLILHMGRFNPRLLP